MNEQFKYHEQPRLEISKNEKTRFFSEFAAGMKSDMRTLQSGGVLGKDAKEAGWRNVSEHCLVEALEAQILAEKLGLDPDKLKKAAVIHDWYKRREIELVEKHGPTAHDSTIAEDAELLHTMGYDDQVIKISKSVGHSALSQMESKDVTLEEMVMHYIDDITANTDIVMLEQRMEKNEKNIKLQKLDEMTPFFARQREIGKKIESIIASKLGIDPPEELPNFIKKEIERKITTHNT